MNQVSCSLHQFLEKQLLILSDVEDASSLEDNIYALAITIILNIKEKQNKSLEIPISNKILAQDVARDAARFLEKQQDSYGIVRKRQVVLLEKKVSLLAGVMLGLLVDLSGRVSSKNRLELTRDIVIKVISEDGLLLVELANSLEREKAQDLKNRLSRVFKIDVFSKRMNEIFGCFNIYSKL